MDLLTVHETAALLKVNPDTVRRYITSGRLPAVRIGRRVRIHKEAIEALAEPIRPKEVTLMHERPHSQADVGQRRLTDAEVTAALATMKQAQQLREAMQARRGGNLLPESWPDLRDAREERANQL
jgi:excisionase family DNA binding protein